MGLRPAAMPTVPAGSAEASHLVPPTWIGPPATRDPTTTAPPGVPAAADPPNV